MFQETLTAQPVIEAGRFVLRPLRRSDAGLISMYTADRRVAAGTTLAADFDDAENEDDGAEVQEPPEGGT